MKTICLYFNIHQPFRFRRYRFFDIGKDHYYYDDYLNEAMMRKLAEKCYLPANKIIQQLFKEYGCNFKVAFSISGVTIDQFELYAPEVLESFQQLAKTNCVEFIAETYSHSLASLINPTEFEKQVTAQSAAIEKYFGQKPTTFRNCGMIYNDEIGANLANMGFKAVLTEGAKHILGWKSPNYVYNNAINPRMKVLLRNNRMSDDLTFNFSNQQWSEFPLTTEKYVDWINKADKKEEILNIFINYETFGEHQKAESGIFDFLRHLPKTVFSKAKGTSFTLPSEAASTLQPIAPVSVPYPISWSDEERDLSAWLGNDLQNEAFNKLYALADTMKKVSDPALIKDWQYLQASDHFYFMSTKFFSDGDVKRVFNPYSSPYDAFINYMNVLSDFAIQIKGSTNGKKNGHSNGNKKEEEPKTEKAVLKSSKVSAEKTTKKATSSTTKTAKTKTVASKKEAKPAAKKAATTKTSKTSKTSNPKTKASADKAKTKAKPAAAKKTSKKK